MALIDNPISSGIELIKSVASPLLKHYFPDPTAQAAALLELTKLEQSGILASMVGQLEINKEEAKSPSLFIAGWRPAVGWVATIALGLAYIPKAIVLTIFWCVQTYALIRYGNLVSLPPYPDLGVTDLLGLLGAILGVGTMRTYEKKTGTEGNR